ncbi:hypothetical protein KFK09_004417 [Dendrobium nobile]|uniref:Uncharacterized protein n=1 Tax=Dendrobium nobile TaxID=94219 RepID=A0A8T3C5Q1_DENNO|nr:hypothetical protein KFK09_004416 [Dendrobium nobile]KAI0525027.1 hypothetical protein KFK09_004417 [Dendrobium nobile]
MRRQSSEPAVLHSSIALLQERFRQLQRVKAKREEREQIRAINEHLHLQQQQPKWFVHPELLHPSSHLRNSSSFLLGESKDFNEFQSLEASLSLRSWPPASVIQSSNGFNEEVDTSLHL